MEKFENEEVKAYLTESSIQDLKNCKLFVKTFGKNFASRMLSRNLDKVYTNTTSTGKAGYYDIADCSITLCASGKDGAPLSVQDIQEKLHIQNTVLHEAVHAIFKKSDKECKRSKMVSGTGILEKYQSKRTNQTMELGRGLNEGLTNWICEKAGKIVKTYEILTNFVRQLEIAIGPKRTMQLCKGNIRKNVSKLLNMSERECIVFLAKIDEIYKIREEVKELNSIVEVLTFFTNEKEKHLDSEKVQEMQKKYQEVKKSEIYRKLRFSFDYKIFLLENKFNDSLESRLSFCQTFEKEKENNIAELRVDVESTIFKKYLQNDFEKFLKSDTIEKEQYKKFNKLLSLMEKDENQQGESIEFQKRFSEKICQLIYPQNPTGAVFLVRKLIQENRLNEINEYSLLDVAAGNVKITEYIRNEKVEFTSCCPNAGESPEQMQYIRNNLMLLKQNIQKKHPNTEMDIFNNAIVVTLEEKQFTFLVDGTNILLANSLDSKETKINFAPEEECNPNLPSIQRKKFLNKLIDTIKPRTAFYEENSENNAIIAAQDIEEERN